MIPRLLALMFVSTCSGCALIENGAYNLCAYPGGWIEDRREDKRNAQLAEFEFAQQPIANADYRDGFLTGFCDYMKEGGDGEPPPLPPKRYWTVAYQNPVGDVSVQTWNEGFKVGARAAKLRGYRDYVTMRNPTSTRVLDRDPNAPIYAPPGHTSRNGSETGLVIGLTPAGTATKDLHQRPPTSGKDLQEESLPHPRTVTPAAIVVTPGTPEIVLPAIGGSQLGTPESQEPEPE